MIFATLYDLRWGVTQNPDTKSDQVLKKGSTKKPKLLVSILQLCNEFWVGWADGMDRKFRDYPDQVQIWYVHTLQESRLLKSWYDIFNVN